MELKGKKPLKDRTEGNKSREPFAYFAELHVIGHAQEAAQALKLGCELLEGVELEA